MHEFDPKLEKRMRGLYNIELYELINKNSLDVVKQTFKISELEMNMKITLFVERKFVEGKHFKKTIFLFLY